MKISILTDGIFPYVMGGMQKHSYYIAKYLARQGCTIDLYHTVPENVAHLGPLAGFSEDEKRNIHAIPVEFPRPGNLPGHYLRRSYQYADRVYREFMKRPIPDFVYIKGFSGWKLLEEKARGQKLPPTGIKFHGYEMYQKPASLRHRLEGWMLRPAVVKNTLLADYTFSYGGKITDIVVSLGLPRERVREITSGITSEWILRQERPTNRARKFGFVGRNERRKGLKELFQAVESLRGKDFELHVIGPIEETARPKDPRVVFHGAISDEEEKKKILDRMDVLVCPSHSEGMPNVILEGMARGLAIIATDVGAVQALVDSKNGWLLRGPKPAVIASAIQEALEMENTLLDMKKADSLKQVQYFTWERIGQEYLQTFQELAGR